MPYKDKTRQKEAQRRHYLDNKEEYIECRRKNRDDREAWLQEYKKGKCCLHCGETDARCFDFHHRDSATKSFSITDAVRYGYSVETILEEMIKCDILCANCHRKVHHDPRHEDSYARYNVGVNAVWFRRYKATRMCACCGTEDSVVLDFHHRDGVGKKGSLANMVGKGCSVQMLLEEIAKCNIYCANCHRKHHDGNKWKEACVKKAQ